MSTLYIVIALIIVLAIVFLFLLRKKKPEAPTEGKIEETASPETPAPEEPTGTEEKPEA